MFPAHAAIVRLTQHHVIKPFDCDDADLNDFLLHDAKISSKELLTVTYILENSESTIAFWSLLNDKVIKKQVDPGFWENLWGSMPEGKRYSSYPAMKIARLAVASDFKGQDIGTAILDSLKALFITNNRTGCKFITVDAYRTSLKFYEKNGFKFMVERDDKQSHTRPMYFDLLPLTRALNNNSE
jgi:GNAT superfamily N-acetyltransferase